MRCLAKCYGISPTMVQKWRRRQTVADRPMRPAELHLTVLTLEQEAASSAGSTENASRRATL